MPRGQSAALGRSRSTFFTPQLQKMYPRSHHHVSHNNSPKTHIPWFTLLELAGYVGSLFYLFYHIKNEKRTPSDGQSSNLNEAKKEMQEPKEPNV